MSDLQRPIVWTASLAGLCLAVAGCTSAPTEPDPNPVAPERFSVRGSAELPDRWWTAFGEPELDRLVESALAANFDLEAAWHRLREARALVDRSSAGLFPEVDVVADGSTQRGDGVDDEEQLLLGVAAGYEVDLWGAIRSSVDAERYRAGATLSDYRTAALSVAAEVTRTWLELVEARRQVEILSEQIEVNERVLSSLEIRFASGLIRGVDVLRQRQLVEATREQRTIQEARAAVLEHLLAVLLGRSPEDPVATGSVDLPPLPPLPDAGVPVEVLQRRPDVRAAWYRLQAADRDLATAIANRYPRLTLTASVVTADDSTSDLFDDWIRTLAGSLLGPVFRGGALAAEVDRTDAVRAARAAEYRQISLEALREVEDALMVESKRAERVASLERQLRLSRETTRQLGTEYLNGSGDFIDLLVAQTAEQRLRRDLLAARRLLLEDRVALYRAVAGEIEMDPGGGAAQDAVSGSQPTADADRRPTG